MSSIDRKQAVAMALRAFKELGSDPERYEMQVEETDTEWQVSFAGKMPRPPGDELLLERHDGIMTQGRGAGPGQGGFDSE